MAKPVDQAPRVRLRSSVTFYNYTLQNQPYILRISEAPSADRVFFLGDSESLYID